MGLCSFHDTLVREAVKHVALDEALGKNIARGILNAYGVANVSEIPDEETGFKVFDACFVALADAHGVNAAKGMFKIDPVEVSAKAEPHTATFTPKTDSEKAALEGFIDSVMKAVFVAPNATLANGGTLKFEDVKALSGYLKWENFKPKPKPHAPRPRRGGTPLMKIQMMIHFATTIGPFTPEPQRTSAAYTKFIKELLRDGLVERPTKRERRDYPGWAYKATKKGIAYVERIKAVELPEQQWT